MTFLLKKIYMYNTFNKFLSSRYLPRWSVLSIDLSIVLFSYVVSYSLRFNFDLKSMNLDRIYMQLLLVVSVLFSHGVRALSSGLLLSLMLVVLVTSLASGVVYVQMWGSRYWRETHPSH